MRISLIISLALSMNSFVARSETIPDELKTFVISALAEVNEAVASNTYLLADFGVIDTKKLSQARLDVDKAFRMQRLALERAAGSSSIASLIEKTQYYYVPYCIESACPGLAAFVYSESQSKSEFVSIGEALLSKALAETEMRRQEFGVDPSAQLIFVSGYQVPMLYFKDPTDGQDRLMIGTDHDAREAARLVLNNSNLSPADRENAKADIINALQLSTYAQELTKGAANSIPKDIQEKATAETIADVIESDTHQEIVEPTPPKTLSSPETPQDSSPTNFRTFLSFLFLAGLAIALCWTFLRRK